MDLAEIGTAILDAGGEVSVSSVRIDAITPQQVAMLARSGHRTLALAPEAGSQRMRDVVNKGVDEAQILAAVRMVAEGGVPNLKLYFMVGLPGESDDDVLAIGALTGRIRQAWEAVGKLRGKLGRLTLSVNPFVPKPWTPLQWAAMEPVARLEKKYRLLQKTDQAAGERRPAVRVVAQRRAARVPGPRRPPQRPDPAAVGRRPRA